MPMAGKGGLTMKHMGMSVLCSILVTIMITGCCFAESETINISDLRRKADAGDMDSMEMLAEYYETGSEQNLSYALIWYQYAAEAGSTKAMMKLGEFCEKGTLLLRDPKAAFDWYSKAAEAGSAEGMIEVGRCWAKGIGVDRTDLKKAYEWFEKARDAGAENLDERIDEILHGKSDTELITDNIMDVYAPYIKQASAFDYSYSSTHSPTGQYEYAIVRLDKDDAYPALLLGQCSSNLVHNVRFFKYDADTQKVLDLGNGQDTPHHHYQMFTDDLSLTIFEYGDEEEVYYYKAVVEDGKITFPLLWGGAMGNTPGSREIVELNWHTVENDSVSPANDSTALATDSTTTGLPTLETIDETARDLYRTYIQEAIRFDYQDYGEPVSGYQFALVYINQDDPIPALLLAELDGFGVRYLKVFLYDKGSKNVIEPFEPLNEYRAALYTREPGRGLLLWYSDGAYDSGIYEVRLEDGKLKYSDVWYGPNGEWPDNVSKEEIEWIDVPQ